MIVLLSILLAAVYTDYRYKLIPNWMIIFGIISGIVIRFMRGNIFDGLEGLGGAFLLLFLCYPVFKIGGLGGGDVKLLAVVGSYLGIKGGIISFVFAFIFGAIFSLVKMLHFHNIKERIYYFVSYMTDVVLKGQWKLYDVKCTDVLNDETSGQKSFYIPKNKIHFAFPVLLGVISYIGGVI